MNLTEYRNGLKKIKGKVFAVVYIFEGETAKGYNHYWVWKSDIIGGWLNAIQFLGGVPLILDTRTFVNKAMNGTLPHIDYILNLNCGNTDLSSLSLIPSVCSFLSIPCIPCDSVAILSSENKIVSNYIANGVNINVPENVNPISTSGIYRPKNLGSSLGVKIGKCGELGDQGIYQKFIKGYDVTIPFLYNPAIDALDMLVPVLYYPENKDPYWIYSLEYKEKGVGFSMHPVQKINSQLKEMLLDFLSIIPIKTYGRIDARIEYDHNTLDNTILSNEITHDNFYFVEVNSMPTIEDNDSWEIALSCVNNNHSNFSEIIKTFTETFNSYNKNAFMLSCAINAYS